jgi:hypothetical protein
VDKEKLKDSHLKIRLKQFKLNLKFLNRGTLNQPTPTTDIQTKLKVLNRQSAQPFLMLLRLSIWCPLQRAINGKTVCKLLHSFSELLSSRTKSRLML